MDIRDLKEEIINRELLPDILSEIGCHHIHDRGDYIQCGNKDGDNPRSIVVYKNEYISCTNYTRQITKNGRSADIFDLIAYCEDCSFAEAMHLVCNLAGLDYYGEKEDEPESLQLLRLLKDMMIGSGEEDATPLKPIPEDILSYYLPYGNVLFEDDGISLDTQHEFEISFDPQTNSICIPIRDELGTLIAVKARRFKYTPSTPMNKRRFPDELGEDESKYFYSEPGAKSQVLYGLYKNAKAIQEQGVVYVGESEKFCMQLYEMGYYGVSTSGSNFMDGIPIYAIIDKDNVLQEKESPSDNVDNWANLVKNHIYQIK